MKLFVLEGEMATYRPNSFVFDIEVEADGHIKTLENLSSKSKE